MTRLVQPKNRDRRRWAQARSCAAIFSAIVLHLSSQTAWAASQLTPKQLEAYANYVGKTYWIAPETSPIPSFHSAPSSSASPFQPKARESFDIKEIVGGTKQIPSYYYKVTFNSGKEGYIGIDSFLEELNAAFVTVDPDREIKIKLAREAEGEKNRQEWIRAQPWPEHVKEAALKRQPALGMNTREARAVLGKPKRVVLLRGTNPLMGSQERWIYEGGPVLTFTNGLITSIRPLEGGGE